jgi:fatty-acyl-CoA synthase
MVRQPGTRYSGSAIPTTGKRRKSGMSTDTIVDRIRTLHDADPERLFCVAIKGDSSERIDYRTLLGEAARFANGLVARGVAAGDRVIIILDFSPDCYYAFLGAMLLGAQPAFLAPLTTKQDPALYYAALQTLMTRLDGAALVISAARCRDIQRLVPGLPARIFEIETKAQFAEDPPARRGAADTAFLQLSSGTTGSKKAVALTHRAVLAQIDAYAATLALARDDVIVSWLPLYHDMGLIACMILPMVSGVPVIAMDAMQWVMRPAMFLRAIEQHRGTLAWLPNFAFHHLAAHSAKGRFDLSSLRAIVNCSEPCKAETFELFHRRFGAMGLRAETLQCCYAMAENVFAITQSAIGRPVRIDRISRDRFARDGIAQPSDADGAAAQHLPSCGPVLPNARVRIVGDAGADLPERHVGEILISSDCLFDAYVNQPDETARRRIGDWYRTGDLGYLSDGELFVAGRKDDLIICNGRNFYAHEIERVVSLVDPVIPGRCIALAVYNEELGSQDIVVLAECRDAGTMEANVVAERIRTAITGEFGLSVHAVRLCRPGELIKTTSGKISRNENLRHYIEHQQTA